MPIPAREEHDWRDACFPGMNIREVSDSERKAAQEALEKKAKEEYAASVAARRDMNAREEAARDAVMAKGSEIKTPAQLHAERLGWIPQPDGSLIHKTELQRRAAQEEAEYEGGPTPAERAALERYLASDDEEEDIWHDVEDA